MQLLINEKDNLKDYSKKYAIRNIIPDITPFLKMTPYLILSTFNRRNIVIVKNFYTVLKNFILFNFKIYKKKSHFKKILI